tara:strand:- start:133952 stop:135478 length:1527 start_codon:yes stop_codon:yes gene_type:complete
MSFFETADDFLAVKSDYQLGFLTTEKPHEWTTGLGEMCSLDIGNALSMIQRVDTQAMSKLSGFSDQLQDLYAAIRKVHYDGGRLFIVGCGATGRLAINLEALWRSELALPENFVCSFMAGGDVALVRSLEGYEDHPEYGERHLKQMGFTSDDMLVAVTEGGETPYVLGAAVAGSGISKYPVHLMMSNPEEEAYRIPRSRSAIEHSNIQASFWNTGSMALAGSTRMQSSTILMSALALCLQSLSTPERFSENLAELQSWHAQLDYSKLSPLTLWESDQLIRGERVLYRAKEFALPVFTDTTERAPTFSMQTMLPAKEMRDHIHVLVNVAIAGSMDAESSWHHLLYREPHSLNWSDVETKSKYLLSFDFSSKFGAEWLGEDDSSLISVVYQNESIQFEYGAGESVSFSAPKNNSWFQHLILKMLLNAHSTCLMGRAGRFQSNIMTWVKPSNGKLIDRVTRYVSYLLHHEGFTSFSYEDIVHRVFKIKKSLHPDEAIVLKVLHSFMEDGES